MRQLFIDIMIQVMNVLCIGGAIVVVWFAISLMREDNKRELEQLGRLRKAKDGKK